MEVGMERAPIKLGGSSWGEQHGIVRVKGIELPFTRSLPSRLSRSVFACDRQGCDACDDFLIDAAFAQDVNSFSDALLDTLLDAFCFATFDCFAFQTS